MYEKIWKYWVKGKDNALSAIASKPKKKRDADLEEAKAYVHPEPMLYPRTMKNVRSFFEEDWDLLNQKSDKNKYQIEKERKLKQYL